jgi:hypothetical protein
MRMKTAILSYAAAALLFAPLAALAQIPGIISYQGLITSHGTNFTGTGQFKFVLVRGTSTNSLWSNDGTSANGGEPAAAVGVGVTNGLFTVLLGDTTLANMVSIPVPIFTNADVRLRIWFSDGGPFARLSPDQRLTSVGYAMRAGGVIDNSISGDDITDNTVTSADIANTLTLQRLNLGSINWDGSLYLYAEPMGGGGLANPNGSPRGHLLGDVIGSELALFFSNSQTGVVVSSRSPGGRVRLWDSFGTLSALLGTVGGGGDLNLFQISGDPGITLDGDRSTFDNLESSGGEISVYNRNGVVGLLLDGDHDTAGRIEVRQPNGSPYVDIFGRGAGNAGEIRVKTSGGTISGVQILGGETGGTGGQVTLRQADNTETIILDGEFNAGGGGRIDMRNGSGTSTIGLGASGGDATLAGGGLLRLGPLDGANLVLDQNEITARNNGVQAPLFLNPNQGNVVIGRGSELTPPARLLVESDPGQDSLRVRVGTSTRFYVSGSGQVGINTTNLATGYELSVNGQVICEELVVEVSGNWPDYVFADDYKPMPIEELEAAIKRDKRLPGVPSAAEVEKKGLSVGQMQKQMMEKIEELTLYIIDQDRQIKAQRDEIRELRAQVTTRSGERNVSNLR